MCKNLDLSDRIRRLSEEKDQVEKKLIKFLYIYVDLNIIDLPEIRL